MTRLPGAAWPALACPRLSTPRRGRTARHRAARPGAAGAESTGRLGSRFTTVGGGLGLLILVATILLGGVGSAAVRTVLAQQGADMGT